MVAPGQWVGVQVRVLVREHVEIRPGDLAAVDGVDHLLLHHDAAAGGVDEHEVVGDLVEELLADEVLGALDQGDVQADIVALAEEGLHVDHRDAVLIADGLVDERIGGEDAHAEAGEVLRHEPRNLAEAGEADRLVAQTVDVGADGVIPLLVGTDAAVIGEQALVVGEDAGGDIVRDVDGEGALQVRDGDAALLRGLEIDVVIAHALAGDELELRQGMDDAGGERLENAHHGVGVLAGADDLVLGGADMLLDLADAAQGVLLETDAVLVIE